MYLLGLGTSDSPVPDCSSRHNACAHLPFSGAALGPLLAGLISPSGWNNVFYMLMFADACALLVSRPSPSPRSPPRASVVSARGLPQLSGTLGL